MGVISPTFFAMLVIMAVVTTMMAPPLLPFLGYRQKDAPEQGAMVTDPEKPGSFQSSPRRITTVL